MHRLFGFLVLVAFTAGPALGAPCLRSCLHDERGALAKTSCHQSAVPQHRLANVHDCSVHEGPAAVAAKRLEPVSVSVIAPSVAGFLVGLVAAARTESRHQTFALGSPAVPFLIPLRI
jgi:hypothetical protein